MEQELLAFEISIGGYTGFSYALEKEGDALLYRAYDYGYEPRLPMRICPTAAQWAALWARLDKIGIWSWREHYECFPMGPCDGTGWSVLIETRTHRVQSSGSNAYPGAEREDGGPSPSGVFDAFLAAVRRLLGGLDFE